MTINYSFKNFTAEEKQKFEEYFATKISHIEEAIKDFTGAGKLQVRVEKFATKKAYKLSLNLGMPDINIFVSEDDHTINEVIDLTKDKLVAQVRKIRSRAKPKL